MGETYGDRVRCAGCGWEAGQAFWPSCFCPQCDRLNASLYRREHADPDLAATMTEADIRREYAAADQPFRHLERPSIASILAPLHATAGRYGRKTAR